MRISDWSSDVCSSDLSKSSTDGHCPTDRGSLLCDSIRTGRGVSQMTLAHSTLSSQPTVKARDSLAPGPSELGSASVSVVPDYFENNLLYKFQREPFSPHSGAQHLTHQTSKSIKRN